MKNKILLHTCCAPCMTSSLEKLNSLEIPAEIFWYNPNIEPFSEHKKRHETLISFLKKKDIENILADADYDYLEENSLWHRYIAGFEDGPEGGERCKKCIEFRLQKTADMSEKMKISFSTTLPVSPHKNSAMIEKIGQKISNLFIFFDFKKEDGYKKSIDISKDFNLYRQNYCGCQYSQRTQKDNLD
jgi:predicted adenine nucleotide alpha hydrolase (AANH) superfamily ATPase